MIRFQKLADNGLRSDKFYETLGFEFTYDLFIEDSSLAENAIDKQIKFLTRDPMNIFWYYDQIFKYLDDKIAKMKQIESDFFDNIDSNKAEKSIINCPNCSQKLSIPADRSGAIRCPRCDGRFRVG